MNKIILDLCGGTGAWSYPYKKNGYDVYNITLPNFDINDIDVQKFCIFLNPHGILAAPPCQMFSLARTRAKEPRNFKVGMECVISCLNIIWKIRYFHKLKFWCLENPTGFLRQFLGLPAFTFKPYEFGDCTRKRTDLWGYFKIPKKSKIPGIAPVGYHRSSKLFPRNPIERAITPPNFANVFYKANK